MARGLWPETALDTHEEKGSEMHFEFTDCQDCRRERKETYPENDASDCDPADLP
jgi:hypothetical protein